MKIRTGKNQQNQHLTPASVTGQRFTQYYYHGWDFIEKDGEKWRTIKKYPLSPRQIWDKHQNPHKILGLRFGKTTRIIIIDIDRGSIYHPANNPKLLKTLLNTLETIGLCRHVLIQSSFSEGIHIIFPLSEALPTFKSACLVQTTLQDAGFNIKTGQLEIFPNPKRAAKKGKFTLYNGLRLPLQPDSGSYLLDDELNITSDSPSDFLNEMDLAASGQDLETFTALLDLAYEEFLAQLSWQKDPYSRTAIAWKQALEKLISQGWTGYHQTNYLLTKFVAYQIVFKQCLGEKLIESVKQAVINAPGYTQWCRHQHEIDRRIEEVCYYTERNEYYLPYRNHPNRTTNFNQTYNHHKANKRTSEIENRLTETLAHLETLGQLPEQVAQRRQEIIKTAQEKFGIGFSTRTLSRKNYLALWHPQYRLSEKTKQTQSQSEINPQITPPNCQKTQEPPIPETLNQSGVVSNSPIYEVFVCDQSCSQKKAQIKTITIPESPTPTHQPLPDAPLKISEIPPQLHSRIANLHANKQAFVSKGLPIPYGIQALEAELMAELARLTSRDDESIVKPNEPLLNRQIDAVEDISETTPQKLPNHQSNCTEHQSTIDNNQSIAPKYKKIGINQPSSPTNTQLQKLNKKKLFEKCNDYGVEVNPTIERLIKFNPSEVVLNALEALREHKRDGVLKNPAGFLVKAIKQKWQPSTATKESTPVTHPTGITDEFLQWYKAAIAAGLVEDVPVNWLPMYQNREPMVRVLPPNGRSPYTSMRWGQAKELYPLTTV